jgi:hypothetical protein
MVALTIRLTVALSAATAPQTARRIKKFANPRGIRRGLAQFFGVKVTNRKPIVC